MSSLLPLLVSLLILSNTQSYDCTFTSTYPRTYKILRTATPPPLTGSPSSPFWLSIPSSSTFVDITGDPDLEPRFDTSFKMVYDDDYLYVLGNIQEPQVWGKLTTPNSVIFSDNDFELFVDPPGSTHMYKEIEVNALGTMWNLCLNEPYGDGGYENSTRVMSPSFDMLGEPYITDPSWNTMKSAVTYNPEGLINDPSTSPSVGWGVELAVPLSGLIYNTTTPLPKSGDFWRLDFSRVEWRVLVNESTNTYYKDPLYPNEDNWVWNPIGVVAMHNPDKWGIVQFGDEVGVDDGIVGDYGSWGVRELLMNVYYAQNSYRSANGVYTMDLEELDELAPEGGCIKGCGTDLDVEVGDGGWKGKGSLNGWRGTVDNTRFLQVEEITR